MIPAGNNVYGLVIAPQGLQAILGAAMSLVGEKQARLYKSQYNGAETLHFGTGGIQFDSTPLEETGWHLLNGEVCGSQEAVARFIESMSRLFAEVGIYHRFEIYDDDGNLLQEIPG